MSVTPRRKHFLTFASVVALGVGSVALFAPEVLLSTKGIVGNAAANVWMREVGVMLVAVGFIAWCVRSHLDSPTMRAFLWGNALLQLLLLPVEILAYAQGTITTLSGIVPNSILHLLLGLGFFLSARDSTPVIGMPLGVDLPDPTLAKGRCSRLQEFLGS